MEYQPKWSSFLGKGDSAMPDRKRKSCISHGIGRWDVPDETDASDAVHATSIPPEEDQDQVEPEEDDNNA